VPVTSPPSSERMSSACGARPCFPGGPSVGSVSRSRTRAFASAKGPAYKFWTALATAVSYGGHALGRLDRPDGYYTPLMTELAELRCPVSPDIDGLAGARLGLLNPENIARLRDIVTRHRRRWAEESLGRYLEARWRADLTAASDAYSRRAADKAKDPAPKHFAPDASAAANNWFAGDLTGVYRAIGLKLQFESTADLRLPADVRPFINRVHALLDAAVPVPAPSGAAVPEREPSARRVVTIGGLARSAVLWVQLREALGRPPELKDYPHQFDHSAQNLVLGIDDAWVVFSAAVEGALTQLSREDGSARL
jgi:hypothetical protein